MCINIAIRTDGSIKLGNGHIIRMLALSDELEIRKMNHIFYIKYDSFWVNSLIKRGKKLIEIKTNKISDFLNSLVTIGITHLIYDTRNDLTKNELLYLKANSNIKVIIIDSPEDLRIAGDLNLYPPIPQVSIWDWSNYNGKIRSGWEYVFLRREFSKFPSKNLTANYNNVILSFGSTDPHNLTEKTINLLENCSDWKFKYKFQIILGPQFERISLIEKLISNSKLNFELIISPQNLLKIFSEARFAIISFGVTAYELASLSVPSFYVTISEDHMISSSVFINENLGFALGDLKTYQLNLDSEVNVFLQNISNYERNKKIKISDWNFIIDEITKV